MKSVFIEKKLKYDPYIFQAKQKNLPEYHYHNINQILFILKGKGKLQLHNEYYPIKSFDLIILNKGDRHKFYPELPEKMILYIIEYSDTFLNTHCQNKNLKQFMKSINNSDKIISTNNAGLLTIPMIIKNMLFEIQHRDTAYDSILSIKLLEILTLIQRYILNNGNLKKAPLKNATEERVWQVIKYIENHYYEKLTLSESAKMAALSQRQFIRIFQNLTGVNFKNYINSIRIEKAKLLLKTTDKEIISVCFEVGFDDLSYFYKVFKRNTNITPKAFKKDT